MLAHPNTPSGNVRDFLCFSEIRDVYLFNGHESDRLKNIASKPKTQSVQGRYSTAVVEFPLKIGKSYDDLPKFRGIAEFSFGNRGKILPLSPFKTNTGIIQRIRY